MSAQPYELPNGLEPHRCRRCEAQWEDGYRCAIAAMRSGLAVRVANDALWGSPIAGVADALRAVAAALTAELEESR